MEVAPLVLQETHRHRQRMNKSTERATCWSVTINHPTDDDEECISLARQKGWTVVGQKEVGEEGTPHYQLMVRTPQVRFSAMKKSFPRAHIEVARAPLALERYVVKAETRVATLPEGQEKYPSLSRFWELITVTIDEHYPNYMTYPVADLQMVFIDAVNRLIRAGYHVESIAVNPTTWTAWKRHWSAIMFRAQDNMDARRNLEEVMVVDNINAPQEVNVPQTDNNSPSSQDAGSSSP